MIALFLSAEILIFAPDCLPFAIALAVMLGIGVIEGIGLMFGVGLGSMLDSLVPELDADLAAGDLGAWGKALGWLHVGRVPALVVLVCALTWFGVVGLGIQALVRSVFGAFAPAIAAAVGAFFVALPLTRLSAGLLGRIMPKDETSAVSRASFVGRVAVMLEAAARKDNPAQAKLYDSHGQAHYVLVQPEDEAAVLPAGEEVLIVRQVGARFTAILNTHTVLSRGESAS